MRTTILPLVLLASIVIDVGAGEPADSRTEKKQAAVEAGVRADERGARSWPPIGLNANDLSIAGGKPSLVLMSSGSTHIPVWSLSGGTVGQSVAGLVTGLPAECAAVKVEIVVTTTEAAQSPDLEDVYRVHLSQLIEDAPFTERYSLGTPVRSAVPTAPFYSRTILLNSYYEVDPAAPLWVRIQREPGDPADTFTRPTGLAMVKVTPLEALAEPRVVQSGGGYNSWPMIQALGEKLVCVYSRGSKHNISEDARAVFARTSGDGGRTWTPETVVADTPGYGDVEVGKGLDSTGAMLLWVRRVGKERHHDLYRTTDGVNFALVATPQLEVNPIQISDVFAVPTVGLMALWFAGSYRDDQARNAWGIVTSGDDGMSWTQTVVESQLSKAEWPTEPSAVYLGDGRILAVGRTEVGRTQFQMVSTDYGKTWTRQPTNIGDVASSTPSLILDAQTGLVSNYYYHRGAGVLRRRVVDPEHVFSRPLGWPVSEPIALGSKVKFDAGNANATAIAGRHYISFYSGKAPETAVLVSEVAAPASRNSSRRPVRATVARD